MGNCLSACLGGRRNGDVYDEEEEAPLRSDAAALHYGSFVQQSMMPKEDSLEDQIETEALQRVVARTSDNMMEIYELGQKDRVGPSYAGQEAPSSPSGTDAFTSFAPLAEPVVQDMRLARLQSLLSRLTMHEDLSGTAAAVAHVDWGAAEDNHDEDVGPAGMRTGGTLVKVEGSGDALVGNFADAAAAMR